MTDAVQKRRRFGVIDVVEVAATVVLLVMAVHVTLNAVLRAYWSHPLPNSLEIVQYWYLPLVALLGILAAYVRGQHLAADLAYRHLPAYGKQIFRVLGLVLAIAVCGGITWYGLQEAIEAYDIKRTGGVSNLVIWPVYFMVPACFGVVTLGFIRDLVTGRELNIADDLDEDLLTEELNKEQAR